MKSMLDSIVSVCIRVNPKDSVVQSVQEAIDAWNALDLSAATGGHFRVNRLGIGQAVADALIHKGYPVLDSDMTAH